MQNVNKKGDGVWGEGGGFMKFFVPFVQFFYISEREVY